MSTEPKGAKKSAAAKVTTNNSDSDSDSGGFNLEEITGDLFSCPKSDSLAHCVSKDLAMGKGIAVLFKKKFGQIDELKNQRKGVGEIARLKITTMNPVSKKLQTRYVYNMITKERSFHKPTLESMEKTLNALRDAALRDNVEVISMPKIGCGLDKLEWSKVKALIHKVFKSTLITIKVYSI